MSNDDEAQRLQRLREQQISKRIPVIKSDKQLSRAATRRKDWSKYTLADALRDMPAKWLYMFVGFIVGLLVGIAVLWAVKAFWAPYGALIIILVFTLVGRVFGLAEDWRHE
ncbi:MAG: hypothetical protein HY872_01990 [Chloroflexi bacterium]|nr:hypothetical protein [Chloroflexota bacterium]